MFRPCWSIMKGLLSKVGRQTGFPVYPIARQTMVYTLGISESEIDRNLSFCDWKSYFIFKIKSRTFAKNFLIQEFAFISDCL